jgi:ATP-dependent protease ClpP protease subunit
MPNWTALLKEIASTKPEGENSAADIVRRKYLAKLHNLTNRNIIAYYSGFLSKPKIEGVEITDEDKNGFMLCAHKLEKDKGLDLFLHTPGGDGAATESLIFYLHELFGHDIRAVVPQIAMSAGTIIACSCKSILMGKHSNIGPVDPQFGGIPAIGIMKELEMAYRQITTDNRYALVWNPILQNITPSFVQQCEWAIERGKELIGRALDQGMFRNIPEEKKKLMLEQAVKRLSELTENKTHSKHFHYDDCVDMGLNVEMLEDKGNAELQDLVLTVHHCFMITLSNTPAFKIIENHLGRAMVRQQQQFLVQQPQFALNIPPEIQAELMKEIEEKKKSPGSGGSTH